jgi:hypothetical protein
VPAAPVDPGTDFVQATPAPAGPAPTLDQNAVSRGAGAPVPAADVGGDPGSGTPDGSGPSLWGAISALTAAAGAAVVAVSRRQALRNRFAHNLHDPDASTGAQEITGVASIFANAGRFAPKPAVDPARHPRDYSTPNSVHYYLDPRGHWISPPAQPGPVDTGTVTPGQPGPPNPGPGQ